MPGQFIKKGMPAWRGTDYHTRNVTGIIIIRKGPVCCIWHPDLMVCVCEFSSVQLRLTPHESACFGSDAMTSVLASSKGALASAVCQRTSLLREAMICSSDTAPSFILKFYITCTYVHIHGQEKAYVPLAM